MNILNWRNFPVIRNLLSPVPERRWVRITLSFCFGILLLLVLLVYAVDPFMRYRKPVFYDPMFRSCYAIAPGMMRHFDFDSLMVGSSMVRNYTLPDLNKSIKTAQSIKISFSSASSRDLKKISDIAFQAKGDRLKVLVYSLDLWATNKPEVNYTRFDYLYRDDFFEDYKYFFSRKTYSAMHQLLKICLSRKVKKKRMHYRSYDTMFCTDYPGKPYGKSLVISEARNCEETRRLPAMPNKNTAVRFRGDILSLVEAHPQTEFVFILPPTSLYYWCMLHNNTFTDDAGNTQNCMDALLAQKSFFLTELLRYSNVRIYDPQQEENIIRDYERYNDITHYSMSVCKQILEGIARDEWRVRSAGDIAANAAKLRYAVSQEMPQYLRDIKQGK